MLWIILVCLCWISWLWPWYCEYMRQTRGERQSISYWWTWVEGLQGLFVLFLQIFYKLEILFFFFWLAHSTWTSWAKDQIHSRACDLRHNCGNARSLTHNAGRARDRTCIPVLPRCHQSRCYTAASPSSKFFKNTSSWEMMRILRPRSCWYQNSAL